MINPTAEGRIWRFEERQDCLVIDDALSDPDGLAQYAVANQRAFRPVDFNAFLGTYRAPPALVTALAALFAQNIRCRFAARRAVRMHWRLSTVTVPSRRHGRISG